MQPLFPVYIIYTFCSAAAVVVVVAFMLCLCVWHDGKIKWNPVFVTGFEFMHCVFVCAHITDLLSLSMSMCCWCMF